MRMVSQHVLTMALRELESLLQAHPHLYSYQEEVNWLLLNSGGTQQRMAVLNLLIEANLAELLKQLNALTVMIHDAAGNPKS